MSQINQMEMQHLRHIIGAQDTAYQKLQSYAQNSQDPQLKAHFEKIAQDAQNVKQKLLTFLN